MSQRYEKTFADLKKKGEGAFIPFVMLGDPDTRESEAIIETLIESGADALELGIPFSDPVADGPVIQTSANRALEKGATPDGCLDILARIRKKYEDIPAGLLVYANLVVGKGAESFYKRAAEAGVDSVLVADVPTLMAPPFVRYAQNAGIDPVFIVPPNASDEKLREVAALTKGYTYFLGRAGVTGADQEMKVPLSSKIALLKEAGAPPVVVGFGISRPEHVRASLKAGADGAISGSATVAIIAAHAGDPGKMGKMHEELAAFVKLMKSATRI
ncbi:MAG: tryptophan synthase subunit alpha [Synergistaceae bacterium]|jgi:tryptophan synthase alpha chain|nr:tryptophan synthase subunit alpha [Synergistaceae bacterium]